MKAIISAILQQMRRCARRRKAACRRRSVAACPRAAPGWWSAEPAAERPTERPLAPLFWRLGSSPERRPNASAAPESSSVIWADGLLEDLNDYERFQIEVLIRTNASAKKLWISEGRVTVCVALDTSVLPSKSIVVGLLFFLHEKTVDNV